MRRLYNVKGSGRVWKRNDLFPLVGVSDGGDEAIAAPGKRFHIPGVLSVVSQSVTNLLYAEIKPALKINEGIVSPERLLNFLAVNNLSRPIRKQKEYAEWLRVEFEGDSGLAQYPVGGVQFEGPEADESGGARR